VKVRLPVDDLMQWRQVSLLLLSVWTYGRSIHRFKIGRIASEEVTLHLVTSKCLPVLLYGSEACHLTKSDIRSMDFMFNRFLMRLFKTKKMEIIQDFINYFNIKLPSSLLNTRFKRFLVKYRVCENFFCSSFAKT
jgi:hypothetical protein